MFYFKSIDQRFGYFHARNFLRFLSIGGKKKLFQILTMDVGDNISCHKYLVNPPISNPFPSVQNIKTFIVCPLEKSR